MLATKIDTQLSYEFSKASHVQLALAARQDPGEQSVKYDRLEIFSATGHAIPFHRYLDQFGNRLSRFEADIGRINIRYQADIHTEPTRPFNVKDWSVREIPDEILQWLHPSRYCESDQLTNTALELFGHTTPGLSRVQAIVDWVHQNVTYEVGSTNSSTRATDVIQIKKGVCRDFAHLSIAFCRALNLPARFVAGYTFFDTPPQDFHAVFEVWLGQWVRFDSTKMAPTEQLIRIAVGRDANDTAFATSWGSMLLTYMRVDITQADIANGQVFVGLNSPQVVG